MSPEVIVGALGTLLVTALITWMTSLSGRMNAFETALRELTETVSSSFTETRVRLDGLEKRLTG